MAQPESQSRWKAVVKWLSGGFSRWTPVLAWLFIVLCAYVFIGASVFPGWWKRFLFGGGLLDIQYWGVAFAYLGAATRRGNPVGLVTILLTILVVGWCVFMLGRLGLGHVLKAVVLPPRSLLTISVLVLALTLGGLIVYPEEYKTPDEQHAELLASLEKPLRSFDFYFRPAPPETGFFLYLDGPKLSRTYNVLQKELSIASQTTTEEGSDERWGKIDLKSLSGGLVSRERLETTIQMVPTDPTPERQAQWLIRTYNELNLAVDLPIFFPRETYESYEAQDARKTLGERGVNLTEQQLGALRTGDMRLLLKKLSRPNAPLLFAGLLRLEAEGSSLRVAVDWGGGAVVKIAGAGSLTNLDDSMRSCVDQAGGCSLEGKFLGIAWRTRQTGPTIHMDVVPLAIW
jgi:hypothetical protein